jgi:hypothetical protein
MILNISENRLETVDSVSVFGKSLIRILAVHITNLAGRKSKVMTATLHIVALLKMNYISNMETKKLLIFIGHSLYCVGYYL